MAAQQHVHGPTADYLSSDPFSSQLARLPPLFSSPTWPDDNVPNRHYVSRYPLTDVASSHPTVEHKISSAHGGRQVGRLDVRIPGLNFSMPVHSSLMTEIPSLWNNFGDVLHLTAPPNLAVDTQVASGTGQTVRGDTSLLKRTAEHAGIAQQDNSFKKVKTSNDTGHCESTAASGTPQTTKMLEFAPQKTKFSFLPPEQVSTLSLGDPSSFRKPNGRPRKRDPNPKPSRGPTVFRSNKPVNTDIPVDIWRHILTFCPLDFLLKARGVCRIFRLALTYESTWKEARMQNYSDEHPNPPAGLTEMQYADLLTGVGCQSKSCPDRKARKTYWAFQRRWCEHCLKKKTTLHGANMAFVDDYPKLPSCIPCATFDNWDKYQFTGIYDTSPSWKRLSPGRKIAYERLAITEMMAEIDDMMCSGANGQAPLEEEQDLWYNRKATENSEHLNQLQATEAWIELDRVKRKDENIVGKERRVAYYRQKAIEMDPPLEFAALEQIPSFKSAIIIQREPTDRSWEVLRKKLEKERAQAEGMIRQERESERMVGVNDQRREDYQKTITRRRHYDTTEQRLVLQIADRVISHLSSRPVADADLIHLILNGVFDEYRQCCLRSSDPGTPYRLLMDDAKMVYELKIEPIFEGWHDVRRSKEAAKLKCPGCIRKDIRHRWKFCDLMKHIFEKHTKNFGDFSIWRIQPQELPPTVRFPWCRIRWPKNLPILAEHHESRGRWDPEERHGISLAQTQGTLRNGIGAFNGRLPDMTQGPPADAFVDNVIYVGHQLRESSLDAHLKSQIAFKYALEKYRASLNFEPRVEVLKVLQVKLMQNRLFDFFEGFRCNTCCQQAEPSRKNKFVNKGSSFSELYTHYSTAHSFQGSAASRWTTNLFNFPSEEDLWHSLTEEGHEAAMEIFQTLFLLDNSAKTFTSMFSDEEPAESAPRSWSETDSSPITPIEQRSPTPAIYMALDRSRNPRATPAISPVSERSSPLPRLDATCLQRSSSEDSSSGFSGYSSSRHPPVARSLAEVRSHAPQGNYRRPTIGQCHPRAPTNPHPSASNGQNGYYSARHRTTRYSSPEVSSGAASPVGTPLDGPPSNGWSRGGYPFAGGSSDPTSFARHSAGVSFGYN